MRGIIEFFASNPEAVATLIVFAIGGLVSTITLLYSVFADYPLIVRRLENRSLVYVDEVLREKVQVVFSRGETMSEVKELRQIDFEIFNSHPRHIAKDCTVTINLCSPNVTVLGVTAANSDNRTPSLGGRRILTRVEAVPAQPVDPILGLTGDRTFPAIVVHIPYLERVLKNDRVFLRITYDGPWLMPEVQGAKSTSSSSYQLMQRRTAIVCLASMLFFSLFPLVASLRMEGIPLLHPRLWRNPYYLIALGLMVTAYLGILIVNLRYRWIRNRLRPILHPFIPPPVLPDSLTQFHFYDTMQQTDSD